MWPSSPTPTGTGSGTSRTRASGCAWCRCSTRSSPCSRATRRTPGSSSTGRWPWSTTTSRSGPRTRSASAPWPRRGDCRWARGTSSWTSSSCRARPSCGTSRAGLLRGAAFGGAMEVGLPARHVRPHRPDAPDPAPGRVRARRGVAGRAVGRRPQPGSCGRHPTGPRCAPSTSPPATATAPRSPTTPRRSCGRVADHEKEIGDFLLDGMLFMNGTDHQEPQPWLGRVVAEANEHPGRLRPRGDHVARLPARRAHRGARAPGRASCARGRGPTSSWAWPRTGST